MRTLFTLSLFYLLIAGCSKKIGPVSYTGGWNVESINYSWQVYTIEGETNEQQLRQIAERLADEHLKKFVTVDIVMVWDSEIAKGATTERFKAAFSASGSWDLSIVMYKGGAFFHKARTGVEDPIGNREILNKKIENWIYKPKH